MITKFFGKIQRRRSKEPSEMRIPAGDLVRRNKLTVLAGFDTNENEVINPDLDQQSRYSSRNTTVVLSADLEDDMIGKLSSGESSFLCREIKRRVGQRGGELPLAPSIYPSSGVCLFVDISGFTALGERLRQEHPPREASMLLAVKITHVIGMLTKTCIDYSGDVAKFCGDALMCIWDCENKEQEDEVLDQARACAMEMLRQIRKFNSEKDQISSLQIHGGVAKGSIMHFHLGSMDDKLRSYLIAGEAISAATDVVHLANPGEFLVARSKEYQLDKNSELSLLDDQQQQQQQKHLNILSLDVPFSISRHISDASIPVVSSPMKLSVAAGLRKSILPGMLNNPYMNSTNTKSENEKTRSIGSPKLGGSVGGGFSSHNSNNNNNNNNNSVTTIISNGERENFPDPSALVTISEDDGNECSTPSLSPMIINEKKNSLFPDLGAPLFLAPPASSNQSRKASSTSVDISSPKSNNVRKGSQLVHHSSSGHASNDGGVSSPSTRRKSSTVTYARKSSTFAKLNLSDVRKNTLEFNIANDNTEATSPKLSSQQQQEPVEISIVQTNDDEHLLELEKLSLDNDIEIVATRRRVRTESDPFLRDGVNRKANKYIPKGLRKSLRNGFSANEMRNRVAILFVGLEHLSLSDEEIRSNQIEDSKLDTLNSAFVKMTRITHSFNGEVRDLLYDDKGCVFIGVFGALSSQNIGKDEENEQEEASPDLCAVRAALAISVEISKPRIGVSAGTCFVGMCGISKRQDFVVMGHEVNMSARYMSYSQPGEILVSPEVFEATKERIKYEQSVVYFGRAAVDDPDSALVKQNGVNTRLKRRVVYKPELSYAKTPSFIALYKFAQNDGELFIGRAKELNKIEGVLSLIIPKDETQQQQKKSVRDTIARKRKAQAKSGTVIIIESPQSGMGRSTLCSQARKLGRGRIKIASSACSSDEEITEPFSAWNQILTSFMGINEAMDRSEIIKVLDEYNDKNSVSGSGPLSRITPESLAFIFPFLIPKRVSLDSVELEGRNLPKDNEELLHLTKTVVKILKNGVNTNGFKVAKGVILSFEEIQFMDLYSLKLLLSVLGEVTKIPGLIILLSYESQDLMNMSNIDLVEVIKLAQSIAIKNGLHINLDGLPKDECVKLIMKSLKLESMNGVSSQVVDTLYQVSKGYPLQFSMLFQFLKEQKVIVYDRTSMSLAQDVKLIASELPQTLTSVILARLELLFDETARYILKVSSILPMGDITAEYVSNLLRWLNKKHQHQGFVIGSKVKLTPELCLDVFQKAVEYRFLYPRKDSSLTSDLDRVFDWKHIEIRDSIRTLSDDSFAERVHTVSRKMRTDSEVSSSNNKTPIHKRRSVGFFEEIDEEEDDEDDEQ